MTEENIKHLTKLSKLSISEEEISKIKKDFDNMLEFVWKLQSIDTDWIDMMYTPIDSSKLDYKRKTNTSCSSECLIKNTPNEVSDNMIVIKSSTVEH